MGAEAIPPCHVAIFDWLPSVGPVSNTSFSVPMRGLLTSNEENTMETGVEQPSQLSVPTVFALSMVRLNEKYSTPRTRSCRLGGDTAYAASIRAEFGPLMPTVYALMSPTPWP